MDKAQAQALLELIADLYRIASRPDPTEAAPPAPETNGVKSPELAVP